MSHRDSCPADWEACREGERAFERGWGTNPYRSQWGEDHCEDAQRAWSRGFHYAEQQAEDRRMEERAARRRHEEREMEESYWRQQEQDRQDDYDQQQYEEYVAAQEAEMTAYYADLWHHDFMDVPNWETDGGAILKAALAGKE